MKFILNLTKLFSFQSFIDLATIWPYYIFESDLYEIRFFRYLQLPYFLQKLEDLVTWSLGKLTSNFNFIKSLAEIIK